MFARALPALRKVIPAPINADFWPVSAAATTTDILVSEISLVRLARVCGTPCVHSAESPAIGSGGRVPTAQRTAILVVTVTAVAHDESGIVFVRTDARLDNLRLVWAEARLLGRASSAREAIALIQCRRDERELNSTDDALVAQLPWDICVGDLIAIPSRPIGVMGDFD